MNSHEIKAVICAAGEGTRMRPLTEKYPKALLPVGEKTIIEYMLDNLSASGLTDVIIVVGYKADTVWEKIGPQYKKCRITYVVNEEYETTNNIYSLWLAREHITDGMIFFNGDIIFHYGILEGVLSNDLENSFAADPFSEIEDDAMKVVLRGGRMRKIGKHLKDDVNAGAIGMYKLSQEASEAYFEEAGKQFEQGNKNISFVVPLQAIVARFQINKHKVLPQYKWVEIDTPKDYERAKKLIGHIAPLKGDYERKLIFSNYKELATSAMRERLLTFAHMGIESALPEKCIPNAVKVQNNTLFVKDRYVPIKDKRIFIIGAGKASAAMAVALEGILGKECITAGVVVSNDTKNLPQKIKVHYADHPIPTEKSVFGAQKIFSLKKQFNIDENDLIIALISGGGSSLMACPAEGVSLYDKQKTIEALIKSGGNVHEITIIKKKISQIKGGKLAQYFYPTPIVSLVLSDVVGNDLSVIASGPLAEDRSTLKDALSIIEKRGIRDEIPEAVLAFLERNKDEDSKKESFTHVHHEILADNDTVLERIKSLAEDEGIVVVMQTQIEGEAKEVAYKICSDIHNYEIKQPTLFLYGGETTVTLDYPHKKGGRNQEFALACLQYMKTRPFNADWCIMSIGTDGIDFIEESAGAIIDPSSLLLAKEKELDVTLSSFLERHKTGRLLEQINSNICTDGPTGTNVCDVMMFLLMPY